MNRAFQNLEFAFALCFFLLSLLHLHEHAAARACTRRDLSAPAPAHAPALSVDEGAAGRRRHRRRPRVRRRALGPAARIALLSTAPKRHRNFPSLLQSLHSEGARRARAALGCRRPPTPPPPNNPPQFPDAQGRPPRVRGDLRARRGARGRLRLSRRLRRAVKFFPAPAFPLPHPFQPFQYTHPHKSLLHPPAAPRARASRARQRCPRASACRRRARARARRAPCARSRGCRTARAPPGARASSSPSRSPRS